MKAEEYDQHLSETDKSIDRLHSLYEQWFQGIERREPMKQRELLQKRIDLMRTHMPRNTAQRFRAQTIIQRWVTMTHHWNKCARQIEEGTFRRDVLRAKRRAAELDAQARAAAERRAAAAPAAPTERAPASPEAASPQVTPTPLATSSTRSFPKAPPPPLPPGAARPAPPSPPPAVSVSRPAAAPAEDAQLRAVYDRYVDARRQNNERVDNLKFETVAASIEKMMPELRKKHAGKQIDFEVVVKDGRVGLKPVAK